MPAVHALHAIWLVRDCTWPAEQSEQVFAPVELSCRVRSWYFPGGQTSQDVPCAPGENRPFAHLVHSDCAERAWNLPDGQDVQDPALARLNVPGSQVVQMPDSTRLN